MFKLFKVFLILTLLFLASWETYGQTFVFDPAKPGCDGSWTDGDCWEVSNSCSVLGGFTNQTSPPSTNPTTTCPVDIIIRGDISISGVPISFGGTLRSIRVENGASFDIVGDASIISDSEVLFDLVENSFFNITNELIISQGSSSDSTLLIIDGDGTSSVVVNSIDLRGRAILLVENGGSLISDGPTKYNGNSSRIDVYGFFRTLEVDIKGGSNHQLNSYGSARIIVEEDIILGGTSDITFNGDSEIDIGGDIDNSGSAKIIASDNAKVYYCGIIKTPKNAVKEGAGSAEFINSCRILPVDYLYIEFEYSKVSNSALLSWATAKEWENSRFEIERSIGDIRNFIKIGEVSGMGWKDSITEYEYVDANLPLSGGNIYYRLKQVDMNGEFSLSKVLSVKMPSVQFTQGVWRAYPNPTDGHQFRIGLLDISQYSEEKISFRIIQPNHVMEAVTVDSEAEMNEYLNQILPTISSGVFVVEIQWGQRIEHIKVLKQK
jgi:hypothetical protein